MNVEELKKENLKLKKCICRRNAIIASLEIKCRRIRKKCKKGNTLIYVVLCICVITAMNDKWCRIMNKFREFNKKFPSEDEKYNKVWNNIWSAHTVAYKYDKMNNDCKVVGYDNNKNIICYSIVLHANEYRIMEYVRNDKVLCYAVVPYIWENMLVEL